MSKQLPSFVYSFLASFLSSIIHSLIHLLTYEFIRFSILVYVCVVLSSLPPSFLTFFGSMISIILFFLLFRSFLSKDYSYFVSLILHASINVRSFYHPSFLIYHPLTYFLTYLLYVLVEYISCCLSNNDIIGIPPSYSTIFISSRKSVGRTVAREREGGGERGREKNRGERE